jgi:hypothetical protein
MWPAFEPTTKKDTELKKSCTVDPSIASPSRATAA